MGKLCPKKCVLCFFKEVFMFIEIKPYEKERLSVRFKAEGDDFSKILKSSA